MNIHEYQAKEIFKRYNVPTPRGYVAFSVEEAVENIDKIVEEIETDDREDLIHTVTLDPAKIKRIIAADREKKEKDAQVDSVIDSLR